MNKKILIGGILGLIVVIAIVAFIFPGKNKDNTLANNVANGNVEDTIKELKDYMMPSRFSSFYCIQSE